MKSAWGRTLTWFDIELAKVVLWTGSPLEHPPSYIRMIADMEYEAALPEAWRDFVYEVKADLFGGA
jgi:hypothetical protein